MRFLSNKFKWDAIERVIATALEVVIPYITVDSLNLPLAWVPVGTVFLAVIKVWISKHLGNPDSASAVKGV